MNKRFTEKQIRLAIKYASRLVTKPFKDEDGDWTFISLGNKYLDIYETHFVPDKYNDIKKLRSKIISEFALIILGYNKLIVSNIIYYGTKHNTRSATRQFVKYNNPMYRLPMPLEQ